MSDAIGAMPEDVNFLPLDRIKRLVKAIRDKAYRHAFLSRQVRAFLATQIRNLRGNLSQVAFGRLLDKPQSVVSRLESQDYGQLNVQTLIDVAQKLDVGLIIRFVDYPTFLKFAGDVSQATLAPQAYSDAAMSAFLEEERSRAIMNIKPLQERGSSEYAQIDHKSAYGSSGTNYLASIGTSGTTASVQITQLNISVTSPLPSPIVQQVRRHG